MIALIRTVKQLINHLSLGERAIIKIDLIVLGLLLAKLFPVLTSFDRVWYVVVLVVVEIYFIWRLWHLPKN